MHEFGLWYRSAEHAYQMKKAEYHNNREAINEIRRANDSRKVLRMAKQIKTTFEWKWDRIQVMNDILKAKAQQCSEYSSKLLQSSQATLCENTHHPFWGAKNGENKLGVLHMSIRDDLRNGHVTPTTDPQPEPSSDRPPQPSSRVQSCLHLRSQQVPPTDPQPKPSPHRPPQPSSRAQSGLHLHSQQASSTDTQPQPAPDRPPQPHSRAQNGLHLHSQHHHTPSQSTMPPTPILVSILGDSYTKYI